MGLLKKPYEISVWDGILDGQGNYTEVKRFVIGSDAALGDNRVFEPILARKTDGTKTLTFKMYKRYIDTISGQETQNIFVNELYNERKIKLYYENKWYDFVIKKIEELSKDYLYSYSLEDELVNELSKKGYHVTLKDEDMNNFGTATKLAAAVLKGSGWGVSPESDCLVEKIPENLVYVTLPSNLTNFDIYKVDDSRVESYGEGVIPKKLVGTELAPLQGAIVLAFYSCVKNKPDRFQFIYASKYTEVNNPAISRTEDHIINQIGCQYYFDIPGKSVPSGYVKKGQYYLPEINGNQIIPTPEKQLPEVSQISTLYRGNRYGFAEEGYFVPALKRYVNLYQVGDEVYCGYQQANINPDTFLTNIIVQPQGISDIGWSTEKNAKITPVGGRFATNEEGVKFFKDSADDIFEGNLASTEWTTYLKYTPSGSTSTRIMNNSFNSFATTVGQINQDEEWAFRCEAYAENGSPVSTDQFNVKIIESYFDEQKGIFSPKTNSKIQFNDGELVTQGKNKYFVFKVINGASLDYCLHNSQLRIIINPNTSNTLYLTNFELFRVERSESGKILELENGLTNATNAKISKQYLYFPQNQIKDDNGFKENITADSLVMQQSSEQIYSPIYNDKAEKIYSIKAEKSNYFNILQTIAETFQAWLELCITRDEEGRILEKTVAFRKYTGDYNPAGFKYGVNLKDITRTKESKELVTKMYVNPNNNEFAENGFCTIQRAGSNPTGEDYLYNFQYYFNKGLLDEGLYNDVIYTNKAIEWDNTAFWSIVQGIFSQEETSTAGYYGILKLFNEKIAKEEEEKSELLLVKNRLKQSVQTATDTITSAEDGFKNIDKRLKAAIGMGTSNLIQLFNSYEDKIGFYLDGNIVFDSNDKTVQNYVLEQNKSSLDGRIKWFPSQNDDIQVFLTHSGSSGSLTCKWNKVFEFPSYNYKVIQTTSAELDKKFWKKYSLREDPNSPTITFPDTFGTKFYVNFYGGTVVCYENQGTWTKKVGIQTIPSGEKVVLDVEWIKIIKEDVLESSFYNNLECYEITCLTSKGISAKRYIYYSSETIASFSSDMPVHKPAYRGADVEEGRDKRKWYYRELAEADILGTKAVIETYNPEREKWVEEPCQIQVDLSLYPMTYLGKDNEEEDGEEVFPIRGSLNTSLLLSLYDGEAFQSFPQQKYSFLLLNDNKNENLIEQAREQLRSRTDIASEITSYAELTKQKSSAQAALEKSSGDLEICETQLLEKEEIVKKILEAKEKCNSIFQERYRDFIYEGAWTDESHYDDDDYYLNAQGILLDSCFPKTQYTINVMGAIPLPGYDAYDVQLGQHTFVEDPDFFGEGVREEVVVTEIQDNLDNNSSRTIKVQNYKNYFKDLFQKINATVQTINRRTGAYEKSSSILLGSAEKKSDFLQEAYSSGNQYNIGSLQMTLGSNGFELVDEVSGDGIRFTTKGNIEFKKVDANGSSWVSVFSASSGMSANQLNGGVINAKNITIGSDKNNPDFYWGPNGITALPAKGEGYQFVRFDQYGLYGLDNVKDSRGSLIHYKGGSYNNEADILKNATFALTWSGLKVTGGSGKQTVVANIGRQDSNIINIVKQVGEDKIPIFQVSNNGDMLLTGKINALAGGSLAGWQVGDNSLISKMGVPGESGIHFYSEGLRNDKKLFGNPHTEQHWMLLVGNAFGVTAEGTLYTTKGQLNNAWIDDDGLHFGETLCEQISVDTIIRREAEITALAADVIKATKITASSIIIETDTKKLFEASVGDIDYTTGEPIIKEEPYVRIAGWEVDYDSIYTKNYSLGNPNSFHMYSSGRQLTDTEIGELTEDSLFKNKASWALGIGQNFGVTSGGNLYCNDGVFTGTVNAIKGSIAGFEIEDGMLVSPHYQIEHNANWGVTGGIETHDYIFRMGIPKSIVDDWEYIFGIEDSNTYIQPNGHISGPITEFPFILKKDGDVYIKEGRFSYFDIGKDTVDSPEWYTEHGLSVYPRIGAWSQGRDWGGNEDAGYGGYPEINFKAGNISPSGQKAQPEQRMFLNSARMQIREWFEDGGDWGTEISPSRISFWNEDYNYAFSISVGSYGTSAETVMQIFSPLGKDIVLTASGKSVRVSELVFEGPYDIKYGDTVIGKIHKLGPVVYGYIRSDIPVSKNDADFSIDTTRPLPPPYADQTVNCTYTGFGGSLRQMEVVIGEENGNLAIKRARATQLGGPYTSHWTYFCYGANEKHHPD